MGDAMLGGAPGTAATVAAASILVAEGGTVALRWGAACYALLGALWVLADVARAWWSLRGRLPIVPWRPNLLFRVYPVSKRDLLDRVSRRMDASARVVVAAADAAPRNKKSRNRHPPRAFGAVVGTCPFAHIGGASLANAALKSQPVKAPLYRAFEPFAGGGSSPPRARRGRRGGRRFSTRSRPRASSRSRRRPFGTPGRRCERCGR